VVHGSYQADRQNAPRPDIVDAQQHLGKDAVGRLNLANNGVSTMAPNTGTIDRVVRVALGVGLLALVFVGPATPFGWLGIVPLATGLVGSCPLYQLMGVSTKSPQKAS
jgi:hypothetical protein